MKIIANQENMIMEMKSYAISLENYLKLSMERINKFTEIQCQYKMQTEHIEVDKIIMECKEYIN